MIDKDEKKGQSALFAVLDNKRDNAKNEGAFSSSQKALAADIQVWADNAYVGAKVYKPTCRGGFIAIKVEKPGANRLRVEVQELNNKLENYGIEIVKTPKGSIVYHLPIDLEIDYEGV